MVVVIVEVWGSGIVETGKEMVCLCRQDQLQGSRRMGIAEWKELWTVRTPSVYCFLLHCNSHSHHP